MNKSLAAHYYKLSADQGFANAQFNYGVCLETGSGIEMNKSLAAHYFKLAADQGHPQARLRYEGILTDADHN
jgi:TPR repeat protein